MEHLDEIEELELLLAHYAITWGYADRTMQSEQPEAANISRGGLEKWNLPLQAVAQEEAW